MNPRIKEIRDQMSNLTKKTLALWRLQSEFIDDVEFVQQIKELGKDIRQKHEEWCIELCMELYRERTSQRKLLTNNKEL